MDADLDTLATALYARIDDTLKGRPDLQPWRPKVRIAPKLPDAGPCPQQRLFSLLIAEPYQSFATKMSLTSASDDPAW